VGRELGRGGGREGGGREMDSPFKFLNTPLQMYILRAQEAI